MATSRRVARVAELIKREISQMLLSGIKDDRVASGMVSVTDVDVSNDLQHAKIFVSVYGTDAARAEAMAGLKSATGFVRSELGHRIRLRRTPEVVFLEDRSLERGTRLLSLINRLSEERQAAEALRGPEEIPEGQENRSRKHDSEEDYEDDFEDSFEDDYEDDYEDSFEDEDEDEEVDNRSSRSGRSR